MPIPSKGTPANSNGSSPQILNQSGQPFPQRAAAEPRKSASPAAGRYKPPTFDNFDAKKERAPMADLASVLGDMFGGVAGFLTDHNTLMALGYAGAGLCLSLSIGGYTRVFSPILAASLGSATAGWLSGFAVSVFVAVIVQYAQIAPNMPKYDPDMADRLAYKLGLRRFVNPTQTDDSPTMLPRTTRWARTGHEKAHKEAETASLLAYAFEAIGAFFAFPIVVNGSLSLGALFLAFLAVRGFETAFKFASKQKSLRLNSRESQKYKLLLRSKRQQAEQSMK